MNKVDITIKNIERDTLALISSKALEKRVEIQDYIKHLIQAEAEKIEKENNEIDEEIQKLLKSIAEFYCS